LKYFSILAIFSIAQLVCAARAADLNSLPDAPTPAIADGGSAAVPDAPMPQPDVIGPVTLRGLPKNFVKDQEAIWTSPARIRASDLNWAVPLAAVTALAIATDRSTMIHVVPTDAAFNHDSIQASNVLLGTLVTVPVLNLGIGAFGKHEHARETGLLFMETAADSAVVEQGMKLMFWRDRPSVDNAKGKFWQKSAGVDSSFPSSHAVFAWSTASLLASEYSSPLAQIAVYTMATGVSMTRVMGRDHFPSDVLIGSAAGWLIGHYIARHRSHWELDAQDD
jgi:membrane-associated phospholipid phosphatase